MARRGRAHGARLQPGSWPARAPPAERERGARLRTSGRWPGAAAHVEACARAGRRPWVAWRGAALVPRARSCGGRDRPGRLLRPWGKTSDSWTAEALQPRCAAGPGGSPTSPGTQPPVRALRARRCGGRDGQRRAGPCRTADLRAKRAHGPPGTVPKRRPSCPRKECNGRRLRECSPLRRGVPVPGAHRRRRAPADPARQRCRCRLNRPPGAHPSLWPACESGRRRGRCRHQRDRRATALSRTELPQHVRLDLGPGER